MLDEIKERNRQTQETIDNLRNENAQSKFGIRKFCSFFCMPNIKIEK